MKSLEQTIAEQLAVATEWKSRGRWQPYVDRGNNAHHFGAWFEHLFAQVLGGTIRYPNTKDADIYDEETATHREVKASITGHHPIYVVDQFEDYSRLATTNSIEQIVVRHRVNGMTGTPKEKLHSMAAASPKLAIIFPHSILEQAVARGKPFVSRYPWDGLPVYTLSAKLISLLSQDPAAAITKLGLPADAYGWELYRSTPLKVLGYRVKPIPFRYIQEKN